MEYQDCRQYEEAHIGNHGRGTVDLRKLEQFVAVAEELHFHRAAERLAMSQPPLTVAIRRLEDELGVALIERGNRVLGLTAAGDRFLIEARETLRQTERAIAAARNTAAGLTGFLRLSYVGSALYGRLPDAIRAFRRERPDVRLELREATTAAQVAAIREGALDIGVGIPPLGDANDIQLWTFDRDRLCIAMPSNHVLAGVANLSVDHLADEPFILWPMAEGRGFHLQVIRLCADAGFVPDVVQEAHGMHAVLSLVAVGAGVSIVPESMRGFQSESIAYRPLHGTEPEFGLCLMTRDPSPSATAFIESATKDWRPFSESVEE